MLVSMKDMLNTAASEGYAVGMFDVLNLEMLQGVLSAAEAEASPVMLALYPAFGNFDVFAPTVVHAAKAASVPVCVYLDHGDEAWCKRAMDAGLNTVMIDASSLPYAENVEVTRRVVEAARKRGCSVEAELGHVACGEVVIGSNDGDTENVYTDASEAARFAKETGVDALAVSVGTVHGRYRAKPQLQFNLIRTLKACAGVPLVLHGSSGLSDEDIQNAVACGVAKLNFYTEMSEAASKAVMKGDAGKGYASLMREVANAIAEVVSRKITLLGSKGRAVR